MKIHEEMVGQPYSVKVQRRLLLREDFSKSTAKLNMDERIYFLFSDILVFARVKQSALHYKGHLTLERARIRALSSEETDGNNEWSIEITSSFQGVDTLNTTFMGSPTVHVMHFSNKEDQARWIKYLEVVVDKLAQTAVHNKGNNEIEKPGHMVYSQYDFD